MALIDPAVHRLVPTQRIEQHEHHEVEDAAPERVADGDVGRVRDGDRAHAGEELRQRGRGGEQDEPDPGARQAGLSRDDVAVADQDRPSHADQRHADRELQPGQAIGVMAHVRPAQQPGPACTTSNGREAHAQDDGPHGPVRRHRCRDRAKRRDMGRHDQQHGAQQRATPQTHGLRVTSLCSRPSCGGAC